MAAVHWLLIRYLGETPPLVLFTAMAAGITEAIVSVLSIQHQVDSPTINHFTDDPELDPKLNFTFNKAQERTVNAALSNTFGFGGHNASIIIKKYRQ